MLTAAGSPLVAGSIASERNTMQRKVKVIRSFMLDRKATKVGDVVELPDFKAFEVVSSNKAEYVPLAAPVVVTETEGAKRGSKKDAG